MTPKKMNMKPEDLFSQLPPSLRDELLQTFNEILTQFREGKWEPSELNGGKLCEVIYSILNGYVSGSFPNKSSKPSNMFDACLALSGSSSTFPRSVRIQMPRMLMTLYEVRNNRGVGHVGGDVNPNHMDALVVLHCSKWLMAELIRIFHNVDTATATDAVEDLTSKEIPQIWSVNNVKRVLNNQLSMKEKSLLLLYSESGSVSETNLVSWTEHSNAAVFRRDVLVPGHKARLWEYDRKTKSITLSPKGIEFVEEKLIQEKLQK